MVSLSKYLNVVCSPFHLQGALRASLWLVKATITAALVLWDHHKVRSASLEHRHCNATTVALIAETPVSDYRARAYTSWIN